LQTLGDRQVERLDDNPAVGFRGSFRPKQEVIHLLIDESAVALEVLLVDIEPSRDLENRSNFATLMTWLLGLWFV
jgi:hypothetical protein